MVAGPVQGVGVDAQDDVAQRHGGRAAGQDQADDPPQTPRGNPPWSSSTPAWHRARPPVSSVGKTNASPTAVVGPAHR